MVSTPDNQDKKNAGLAEGAAVQMRLRKRLRENARRLGQGA
jgi:hypothetical protein